MFLKNTIKKIFIVMWISIFLSQHIFANQIIQISNINDTKVLTTEIDKTFIWYAKSDKDLFWNMKQLCNTLIDKNFNLWTLTFKEDIDNPMEQWVTYKAQESLFVTIVCNSLLNNKEDKSAQEKSLPMNNIIKNYNIRSLWIACTSSTNTINNANPNCEQRKKNNSTDFPFIFYNVITKILNDVFNLSIAHSYGAINNNTSAKDLANIYSINYFWSLSFMPEDKSYPKTYQKLIEYITIWKNLQKSTTIIDINKLKDSESLKNLDQRKLFLQYTNNNTSGGENTQDLLPTYHGVRTNIIYNELFFYTLFNKVYSMYLDNYRTDDKQLPTSLQGTPIKDAITLQRARSEAQEQKVLWATDQSLRQINSIAANLPIHIGMLMYQEDLLKLRNNLAKIYLPIHQLHYKLENIQSKE